MITNVATPATAPPALAPGTPIATSEFAFRIYGADTNRSTWNHAISEDAEPVNVATGGVDAAIKQAGMLMAGVPSSDSRLLGVHSLEDGSVWISDLASVMQGSARPEPQPKHVSRDGRWFQSGLNNIVGSFVHRSETWHRGSDTLEAIVGRGGAPKDQGGSDKEVNIVDFRGLLGMKDSAKAERLLRS